MSDLTDLQMQIALALRARGALERSAEATTFADAHISASDRLAPVEQLEIYREQFWLRHTSSLAEDFPGVGGIIGQKAWERLTEEYLEAQPPQSFTLRDVGLDLPEFIEQATWLEHRELCLDMARLERAHIEIFDCEDGAALDPARLANVPDEAWETARLELSPALRLLRVRYPVVGLWRALRNAGDNPVAIPEQSPQNLAIYRSEFRILHAELSEPAFALLEALREGVPLVPACARVEACFPHGPLELEAQVAGWFQDFASRGFFTNVVHT